MAAFIEMAGRRFNRLTAVAYSHTAKGKYKLAYWHCVCDCGAKVVVSGAQLRKGGTKSCGCLQREKVGLLHRTHGLSRLHEYKVWGNMIQRCTNPKDTGWRFYGARGVTVCDRWLKSFEAFFADMGKRPSKDLSIDRIRSTGAYEPGNCRWTTRKVQNRNTRSNRLITYNGRTQTLADWADETGLPYGLIRSRIGRLGWSLERALTQPVSKQRGYHDSRAQQERKAA